MHYPFKFARAIALVTGDIIQGRLDTAGDAINDGSRFASIDTNKPICFNTGFVDKHGNEIFTGDTVETDVPCQVIFIADFGAFFLKSSLENKRELDEHGFSVHSIIRYEQMRAADRDRYEITGSILDTHSEHEELTS